MHIVLLLFLFLMLPCNSFSEIKIVELKYRAAEDVAEKVRGVLAESEKVQAAGHHLVLIADGESLQAALELIELLDRQQQNLVIRIRQVEEKVSAGTDMANSVRYSTQSGFSGDSELSVRRGNAVTSREQSLALLEGSRGFIEVGKEIPYSRQWAVISGDVEGYSESVAYQPITTGFRVVPVRVFDNEVLIDVEPYFSEVGSTKPGGTPIIEFSQLRTRLKVPMAQWYPLGQQMMHRDKVSRAIISWRTAGHQAEQAVEIRIDRTD